MDGKGLNTFNPMLRDTITLPVWGGGGNVRGGGSIDLPGEGLNTFNPMLRDTITLPVWGRGGMGADL